jgi:hypothetical protein
MNLTGILGVIDNFGYGVPSALPLLLSCPGTSKVRCNSVVKADVHAQLHAMKWDMKHRAQAGHMLAE